jgi:UDP-N-acetylmuramoylalanine--D-glutamate ligase
MDWKNKRVGILGWGTDTQDVEPWLREQGAEITVLDEKDKPFGDLSQFDILVRSPGVQLSRLKGLNVTSKTKIFFDEFKGQIIGVTGTKGKGTTSTLIYEILKAAGKDVFLGGNIGAGLFGSLDKEWAVLELSSFQLIDLDNSRSGDQLRYCCFCALPICHQAITKSPRRAFKYGVKEQ